MKTALECLAVLLIIFNSVIGIREYTKNDLGKLREEVREMFQHAYDSYLRYAYPFDELRPLSCDGVDTWGSYSLTLIDALDTLAIMGNYSEFNRVVELVSRRKDFDSDINVSVFETNIRIVGGLLSAHLLSYKTGLELEPGWPCNGPLLRLAEDAAQRLIAAFDTPTGMPYGTINLRHGVPVGETTVTCTAGIGTFIIEFGTLSRLTGDPLYEEVAMHALSGLYHHRSKLGLVGNHVDVASGRWTAQDAGIGGGVDSYYEYLVKGSILLQKPELIAMFNEARKSIDKHLKKDDWYVWAMMVTGHVTLPVFQSLEAYWPSILTLIGESESAMRSIHNYHSVWKQYGFTPEMYNLGAGEASAARESYPLRPELIESIVYLYRETRDPVLLQMGEDILRSIQHSARTPCGYATIKDVRDHRKEDRMESFFLAETTKYLYLLFDTDNFIHNPGSEGTVIQTQGGECIVEVGGYIFNTEAHPIDPAMLGCCQQGNHGINFDEVNKMYQTFKEADYQRMKSTVEQTRNSNNPESSRMKKQSEVGRETPDKTSSDVTQTLEQLADVLKKKLETPVKLANAEAGRENPDGSEINFTDASSIADVSQLKRQLSEILKKNQEAALERIKTESRSQYENIDGSESGDFKNTNSSNSKEADEKYKEYVESVNTLKETINNLTKKVERNYTDVGNRSESAASVLSLKPEKVWPLAKPEGPPPDIGLLEWLLREWGGPAPAPDTQCHPQAVLERIRRKHLYPAFNSTQHYHLLLTPAPSFLRRISLAGECIKLYD